jgi:hypothetical protein
VQKSAGTGVSSITSAMPFTNSGTVDVQSGTLEFGALTHSSGALFTGTGTFDLPATYTFNGNIDPGSVGGVGTLTFIGNLVLGASSTVTLDASGTATPGVSYDRIVVTSGNVTLNGNGAVAPFGGYTPATSDLLSIITGSSAPAGSWTVPGWSTQFSGNTVQLVRP